LVIFVTSYLRLMNFLAHAYLSRDSETLLIGNFIGDFVKGTQYNHFDQGIIDGILMHRRIDHFTDNHEVFKRSRRRIREKYRHYSGVIIDLFYDHFLARNWGDYENRSLEEFADHVYSILQENYEIIPAEAKRMLPYMMKYNWLVNYSTVDGIDQSLKGLSRRTIHQSGMENAAGDLLSLYPEFEMDFVEFFHEIIDFLEK
jgi:acyl carrier protein phosphodiesterase